MKKLFIFLLIVAFTLPVFAAEYVLESELSNSELNVTTVSPEQIKINAGINKIQTFNVNTKRGVFSQISIPGFHYTMETGKPKLPVMNELIEIPFGNNLEFSIEVVSYDEQELTLLELGADYAILPTQPSLSKSQDPEQVAFVYDENFYTRNNYEELPIAEVHIRGIMRNTRLALVTINPIRYNPANGMVKIYNNIEVNVVFENADFNETSRIKRDYYSPFYEGVLSALPNYKSGADGDDLTQYPVKYVIVSDPMFETQLQPFIEWKKEKGFTVIEAYTDDSNVGNSTSSIQSYLHGLYNAGTTSDPAPSFVLFVGDVGQVPSFSGSTGSHITDLYYCDVTNDMIPDMYHGRFSAGNADELQPQIDKTLAMEKMDVSSDDFTGKAVMIAGWDSGHSVDWGYPQINYGTENYFNVEHNFSDVYVYLSSGGGQHESDIIQNVSDGVTFVNYTAHGSSTSWADPGFTISDINSLNNTDKYATIVGNCCLTNKFEVGECFGEAWLRAENKGAVGYIGGTNSTYWDEDLWWGVGNYPIQSGQGGAAPSYEETGMGAYDANFVFDFNTQAAMILAGNLAVEESSSPRKEYYWEIYELMGDPSYMTYMGIPQNNSAYIPSIITVGATSISITADAGSYVAISKDGELHGVKYFSSSGPSTVNFDPFMQPGMAKVVVTAQNRNPIVEDVQVIVPSVVEMSPETVNINEETSVTLTVYEADGSTPIQGVDIEVNGWGIEAGTITGTSDSNGEVTFSVNPPYGEHLKITGQRPTDSYLLFTEELVVAGGTDLTNPNITPSVAEISLYGKLTPYYEGLLLAICDEEEITLFASGCGIDTSIVGNSLTVIPQEEGIIDAAIAKSGYNVFEKNILVEKVYGTLSGVVVNDIEEGIAGATVRIFSADNLVEPLFVIETNGAGGFSLEEELGVGNYQVEVEKFGFLLYSEEHFLEYGTNNWSMEMVYAPSGTVTGVMTETGTETPLDGTIKIYRIEGDEEIFHSSVIFYATGGGAYSVELPYFTYKFKVTSFHHIPKSIIVLVNSETQNVDFTLDPTTGSILVIDDDSGKRYISKEVDAAGNLLSSTSEVKLDEKGVSADEISQALVDMGFYVVVESSGSTNSADWINYDLIISSSGSNSDPLSSEAYCDDLLNWVSEGGKLLIEGGEIGYDKRSDVEFASNVLHIASWESDNAGNLNQELPDHAISSIPNAVPGQLSIDYNSYGDEDACTVTEDAYIVYSNNGNSGNAGIIVYDDNDVDISAQIVFYTFAFNKIDTEENRVNFLENTILYLSTPEIQGTGVLTGIVDLEGTEIDAGATVEILGTNFSATTDASGNYTIYNIYPGTFGVKASKLGYTSQAVGEVVIDNDNTTEGVNFALQPYVMVFYDDFESGTGLWNMEGSWGLSNEEYTSPTHSLTDSPDGNYESNSTGVSAVSSVPINMEECSEGLLKFWNKYDLGAGDMAFVEVSGDGSFWEIVSTYEGTQCWRTENLLLNDYANHDVLWVRFRLVSNSTDNLDGWYIDDVEILLDAGNALVKGDVNQNGSVEVTDVVSTIKFILNENEPTPSEAWCADMDNDGNISVLDIIKMVNTILNGEGLARATFQQASSLEIIQKGNDVLYKSDGEVAGLEIHLSGIEKGSETITVTDKSGLNQVASSKDNETIVLFYSLDGKTLPVGEHNILNIPEGMKINSVVAADPKGGEIETRIIQVPHSFALYQNYPNPFNPTTNISFDLPEQTVVNLTIYDMLGKEIRQLSNQNYQAGHYTLTWDATNSKGIQVSSGLYFFAIKANNYNKIKKMMLVR